MAPTPPRPHSSSLFGPSTLSSLGSHSLNFSFTVSKCSPPRVPSANFHLSGLLRPQQRYGSVLIL